MNRFLEQLLKNDYFIYYLGLFWADGHVRKDRNEFSIECQERDFADIRNVCNKIPSIKWNIRKRQRREKRKPFGQMSCYIGASSQDLKSFFIDAGFMEKSYTNQNKVLKFIAPEKHYLFWRGYFDGDGCLYVGKTHQLAFWSTINQDWSCLESTLKNLSIASFRIQKYSRKDGRHLSSCLTIGQYRLIQVFMDFIYQGLNFGLKRKYLKFKQFLKKEIKNKTSTHEGVFFVSSHNRWRAFVRASNSRKVIFTKNCLTEVDAVKARRDFLKTQLT